jgi:hypothetical protein
VLELEQAPQAHVGPTLDNHGRHDRILVGVAPDQLAEMLVERAVGVRISYGEAPGFGDVPA